MVSRERQKVLTKKGFLNSQKAYENVNTRSYWGNVHYCHKDTVHARTLMAEIGITNSVDKAEQHCSACGGVK